MTPFEWAITGVFGITAAFAVNYTTQGRWIPAIWFAFVAWSFFGLGFLVFLLRTVQTNPAPNDRPRLDTFAMQVTQLTPGKPLIATVTIRNHGKLPATDFTHIGHLEATYTTVDVAIEVQWWLSGPVKDGPDIFIDTPAYLPFQTVRPLTTVEVDDIKSGKMHVYIAGRWTYNPQRWVKEFCGHLVPFNGRFRFEHCAGFKSKTT